MINYLRSEFYRCFRLKSLYLFWAFCLVSVAGVLALARTQPPEPTYGLFWAMVLTFVSLGAVVFPAFFASLGRKEKGIHVQVISFGMRRWTLFFGDFIVSSALLLLTCAVLFGLCAGAGGLVFRSTFKPAELRMAFDNVANTLLCVWSLCALGQALIYLIRNHGIAISLYFALSFFLPGILQNFEQSAAVARILRFLPMTYVLGGSDISDVHGLTLCVILNLIVWLGCAALVYRKKEF